MTNLLQLLKHHLRQAAAQAKAAFTVANTKHFALAAIRCIHVLLLTAVVASAQTGGGGTSGDGTIQGFLNSAVNTFYSQWRFPISALGVIVAIGLYLSDNPHARPWARRIIIAVGFWALAPTVLDILFDWAGRGNGFNLGTGK